MLPHVVLTSVTVRNSESTDSSKRDYCTQTFLFVTQRIPLEGFDQQLL